MTDSLFYIQQIEKNDPKTITVDKFMAQLDRALTQEPYVLVSTITSASEFLRQHPFPEVLNRLFNTLAKVFGDKSAIPETKLILYRIVQLARECRPFLHAYQTSDVMLRVIMYVSHNLDPEIRALCLMLLDGLASVLCDDSHAQHLIIEGLSAPTIIEKTAAIVAVKQFVQYSKQFCELVLPKIEDLLFSSEISPNLKINLIKILPHFRDGVTLCLRIQALAKRLLEEKPQTEVSIAAFELLAHIEAKGMQTGEHTDILMDSIQQHNNDPMFTQSLFKSMGGISVSSHAEKQKVQKLSSFYPLTDEQKFQYDSAVSAFRSRHWKDMALPQLESIQLGKLHSTFASWIKGLIHLAKSQPTTYTFKDLSLSRMEIKSSQIAVENLTNVFEKGRFFNFPFAYLEVYSEVIYLLNSYLSMINVNRMILLSESVYAKRGIAAQCKLYSNRSAEVLIKLDSLFQKSFDADNESRAQLFLLRQIFDLIHFSLGFFSLPLPARMPNPYFTETNSSTNCQLLELIHWARSQLSKLYEIEKESWKIRITETNVFFVKDILFKLLESSFYLPKAFFHLDYSTEIRLNIKVEGKEADRGKYLVSGASALHPIMVEGFVETNNPAGIKYITVMGSIAALTKTGMEQFKVSHQRSAELPDGLNHFSLHFIFNIQQTSKIRFEVTFIDQVTKKTWKSDTVEEVIIQIGGS